MSTYHTPVLLQEVLDFLRVERGGLYIDATLGGGGHTQQILQRGGRVLGLDVDQDAIEHVLKNFGTGNEIKIVKGNFKDIDTIALKEGFEKVNGILFDLGVSSHQFEEGERGFSFQKDAVLDMRMDRDLQVRALDLLNGLTKKELYELFITYGEEHRALAISESIVRSRLVKPIETTGELVKIINKAVGQSNKGINNATKVFQALRIAVNDELHVIEEALPKALELLGDKGRLIVISFHSLEDRIVKNKFKEFEAKDMGIIITKKPVSPTIAELESNRRARSAKLRVFEKQSKRV